MEQSQAKHAMNTWPTVSLYPMAARHLIAPDGLTACGREITSNYPDWPHKSGPTWPVTADQYRCNQCEKAIHDLDQLRFT